MNILLRVSLGLSILWISETLGQRRPPNYSQNDMPTTSFSCRDKILGGYYSDPETDCQMFHVCVKVPGLGVQDYKFLCPNDTAFDQENQICDDWYNIDCEASTLYYSDNFDLYRIGSDAGHGRTHNAVRLPSNNINNAVSDNIDDDYLQRSDRGENVGSDLLRGSHSGNFFSNRNGKDDDDFEESKKKKNGKSNVRKLLTGKRPIISTTTPATYQTQSGFQVTGQPVPRANFAGRNRGTSNYNRGASQSTTEAPAQRQTETYNTNQRQSYNQRNFYSPTTVRAETINYNAATQKSEFSKTNYYNPSTEKPYEQSPKGGYYENTQSYNSQAASFNSYNPTTPKYQNFQSSSNNYIQSKANYIAPTTKAQANFFSPTTTTTLRPYSQPQTYYNPSTTQAPINYNSESTQAYTNSNYETQRLYKINTAGFNVNNNNNNQYDDGNADEFLKTAPSQNLGASNFNRVQNSYKSFNVSLSSNYNFINPSTTQQPSTYNHQYNPSTTIKPYNNQATQNFYNPSTTLKPSTQQNTYVQSTQYRQPSQAFYNPTTTTTTTQSPYSQPQNSFSSTTQKPFKPNYYNPTTSQQTYYNPSTTAKPLNQNFYNPTQSKPTYNPPAQVTQNTFQEPAQTFYKTSTTAKSFQQNFYNPSTTQKPYQQPSRQQNKNTFNNPSTTVAPLSKSSVRGRVTFARTDATERPRPFTTNAQPKAIKEPKEKDQYDYAYYDDAAHPEYENIDAVDFARTKTKSRS